jgi:hypothetical protein
MDLNIIHVLSVLYAAKSVKWKYGSKQTEETL